VFSNRIRAAPALAALALAAALLLAAAPARAEEPQWVTLPKVTTRDGRELENVQVYGYFKDVDGQRVFVEVDPSTGEEITAYVAGSATEYADTQVLDRYETTQREDESRWREVWPPAPPSWAHAWNFTGLISFRSSTDSTIYYLPFPPSDEDAKLAFGIAAASFYDAVKTTDEGWWNPYIGWVPGYETAPAGSFPARIHVDGWYIGSDYRVSRRAAELADRIAQGFDFDVPPEAGRTGTFFALKPLNELSVLYQQYAQKNEGSWRFLPLIGVDWDADALKLSMRWSVVSVGDPEAPEWARTLAAGDLRGSGWWHPYRIYGEDLAGENRYDAAFSAGYQMYEFWGPLVYGNYGLPGSGYVWGSQDSYEWYFGSGYYDPKTGIVEGPAFGLAASWRPRGIDSGSPDVEYGSFALETFWGYAVDVVSVEQPSAWLDFANRTVWVRNNSEYELSVPVRVMIRWYDSGRTYTLHSVDWEGTVSLAPGETKAAYVWPPDKPDTLQGYQWFWRLEAARYDYMEYTAPGLRADGGAAFLLPAKYLEDTYQPWRFSNPAFWQPNRLRAYGWE